MTRRPIITADPQWALILAVAASLAAVALVRDATRTGKTAPLLARILTPNV